MKYKFFKRITRKYEEKFSREKETDEIRINVNGVEIHITEQQAGCRLDKPHITIFVPREHNYYNNVDSYDMDFDTLIGILTDRYKR